MDAQVTPLLERIDARERERFGDAEQIRAQMDELTARLRELDEEIGNPAVTRKTLLALPPATPEPTEEPPVLPNHPAYQQILNAFAEAPGPKCARDLCQVLDRGTPGGLTRPRGPDPAAHQLPPASVPLDAAGVLRARDACPAGSGQETGPAAMA
ncbi:hypothetical protein ACWGRV_22320 [Streptomyces sp. NPDC055663]